MAPMKAKAVTTLAGSSKFAKSLKKSLAMKRPAAAADAEEADDAEVNREEKIKIVPKGSPLPEQDALSPTVATKDTTDIF